ncbi:MAG TPA: PDZ domain-containing protein, partial [Thermoleophilaceae bacterium]|nr:PDZ domain-containing protein [Thermoleophilaceae bacterium]
PAEKAGLRAGRTPLADEQIVVGGDLITKVDGTVINDPGDVASAIADNEPGETIEVEYFRGRDKRTAEVKLGERPDEAPSTRSRGDREDAPPFP